jgi:hypothetical protein
MLIVDHEDRTIITLDLSTESVEEIALIELNAN